MGFQSGTTFEQILVAAHAESDAELQSSLQSGVFCLAKRMDK